MKKKIGKVFLVLTGILFLIAGLATDAPSAPPSPQKGGILKLSAGEPPFLNPMLRATIHVFSYMTWVFNGLVMIDPTQEEVGVEKVVPSLAEKWEISPDGKIYTFYLRKGVKFHDGLPFTAKDVKYSLDFFADPKRSAQASMAEMMDRVEIVDDHKVRVHLKYAHLPFLLYLSFPYCVILPSHLSTVSPKSPEFLVGTGPFKFKNRIPGRVWIYERNPDYFIKGLPYLDGVEVYTMLWDTTVDAFCGGRLSMTNLRYGLENKTSLAKIKAHAPDAIVKLKPVGVIRGVVFNTAGLKGRKGPWQDVRVRRAMAMTMDYPGSVVAGVGSPELGLNAGIVPQYVPTGLSWKEIEKVLGVDKPMEERVKEAKKLMKEAGYPDGFKAELVTRIATSYVKCSEFMIQEWRKNLNIEIKLSPLQNPVFFPMMEAGDFDLLYEGMPPTYGGAPEETLGMFVSGVPMNRGQWSNQEYDRLYNQLMREINSKKRAEISAKMQRLFHEEVPYIVNVSPIVGTAHRPNLHGHVMQPGHTGWACLDRIWMEK